MSVGRVLNERSGVVGVRCKKRRKKKGQREKVVFFLNINHFLSWFHPLVCLCCCRHEGQTRLEASLNSWLIGFPCLLIVLVDASLPNP